MADSARASGDEALAALGLRPDVSIRNLDLHGSGSESSLPKYFEICKEAGDLLVITACFAVWKQGKFRNGSAKVIPAVPAEGPGSDPGVRVFFFDDNINLSSTNTDVGDAETKGICNLLNPATGSYVDFSQGRNGFKQERAFQHTLVHHSSEYQNVLVQANILEAITNEDYFTSIIEGYSRPGEKLIVFMDVNGTILWDDSIMGLGPAEVLLSTMFGLLQVHPLAPCDFEWDASKRVRLEGPLGLKQLVQDIAGGDNGFYHGFWKGGNCERLLHELGELASIRWSQSNDLLKPEAFMDLYKRYREQMNQVVNHNGITASWFKCVDAMQEGGHSVIILSFGMDTRRVVLATVGDDHERRVPHLTVNLELWSERDSKKFVEQFQPAEVPSGSADQPPDDANQPRFGFLYDLLMSCRCRSDADVVRRKAPTRLCEAWSEAV